jgi:hypothetical protein
MAQRNCPNLNHRRSDAPVRCCSAFGEVVNQEFPIQTCLEAEHAKKRRNQDKYCVDRGEQLIHGSLW